MRKVILLSIICLTVLIANAQSLNLLPAIPEPAANPHLSTAFSGVKTGNTTFTKSFAEADEILQAALAYLHPSSPYKNQQAVLDRLILLLDTVMGGWNNGTQPLNEMQFCFQATVSYLMLKQYKPSVLTNQQKTNWEAGIRKNIDVILAAKPDMYDRQIVGSVWLNGDERLAMGVYFGGLAINDAAAAAKAKSVLEDCMPRTLLADGGTHYVGYANESPSYHGEATIRPFVWYYLFTGSQVIRDFICATKNYIPLVRIPVGEGFHEWSTSPAWKPYYNRTPIKNEALAKAYLCGDPYNFESGQGSTQPYLVYIYKSGLSGKALPDNYMLFDRNCIGPRGRYGNWGVVGTLRDPSIPAPELTETRYLMMDGVNTFVGAFTLNANSNANTYPLNAAFQGTAPEIKYAAGKEKDWQRGQKWAFLTGKDRNDAQTKSKSVYGLSTNYKVSKSRFVETPWKAQQQWVVTPDRVIGMCEIEATTNTTAYGLAQRIQLVAGRRNASGAYKFLNTKPNNEFEYGDLRVKIHSKNFAGIVDTIYHGVMNDSLDNRSVMIELHDAASGNDQSVDYIAGTRRYALIEVTNNARNYSTGVTKLTLATGLEGFEFTESAGRKIRIIQNTTGSSIALNTNTMACPYTKLRMLKSWEENALNVLTISNGNGTIPYTTVPAYGHVLILNSSLTADHQTGYDTYNDVFTLDTSSILTIETNDKLPDNITLKNGILQITNPSFADELKVSVVAANGILVDSFTLNSSTNNLKINMKDKPKGVYILNLKYKNGKTDSYKFIYKNI